MNKQELKKREICKEFTSSVKKSVDLRIKLDELISEVIADHEAKQWKPYPEHEPEFGEEYLFLTDNNYILSSKWYGSIALPGATIIAFRELPTPYQPKEGGEQ